jgi:hypothetical protein
MSFVPWCWGMMSTICSGSPASRAILMPSLTCDAMISADIDADSRS